MTINLPGNAEAVIHIYDGRIRGFSFQNESDAFEAQHRPAAPPLHISRSIERWTTLDGSDQSIDSAPPWSGAITIGNARQVSDFGLTRGAPFRTWRAGPTPLHSGFVRFPVWLIALACLPIPVWAMVQGPWQVHSRRRQNRCLRCDYSLEANTSEICPECGQPIERETTGN